MVVVVAVVVGVAICLHVGWALTMCKLDNVWEASATFLNLTFHFSEERKQEECEGERVRGKEGERKKNQNEQRQISHA